MILDTGFWILVGGMTGWLDDWMIKMIRMRFFLTSDHDLWPLMVGGGR
jgi:hypothetical protein